MTGLDLEAMARVVGVPATIAIVVLVIWLRERKSAVSDPAISALTELASQVRLGLASLANVERQNADNITVTKENNAIIKDVAERVRRSEERGINNENKLDRVIERLAEMRGKMDRHD